MEIKPSGSQLDVLPCELNALRAGQPVRGFLQQCADQLRMIKVKLHKQIILTLFSTTETLKCYLHISDS